MEKQEIQSELYPMSVTLQDFSTGVIRLKAIPISEVKLRQQTAIELTAIETTISVKADCLYIKDNQPCKFWWIIESVNDNICEYRELDMIQAVLKKDSDNSYSLKIEGKDPVINMLKLGLAGEGAIGFGIKPDLKYGKPVICKPEAITFNNIVKCKLTCPDNPMIGSLINVEPVIDEGRFQNCHIRFVGFETDNETDTVDAPVKPQTQCETLVWNEHDRSTKKWILGFGHHEGSSRYSVTFAKPDEKGTYEFGYEIQIAQAAKGPFFTMRKVEIALNNIPKPSVKEFKIEAQGNAINAVGKITGIDPLFTLPLCFEWWKIMEHSYEKVINTRVLLDKPLEPDGRFSVELFKNDEHQSIDLTTISDFAIMFFDDNAPIHHVFDVPLKDFRSFSNGAFDYSQAAQCLCSVEANELAPPPEGINRYCPPKTVIDDTTIIMKSGDSSKYVKVLREDLFNLGYWSVDLTLHPDDYSFSPTFDRFLHDAIKTFQFEHKSVPGIKVDGIVNTVTAQAILDAYNESILVEKEYSRPGVIAEKFDSNVRFYQLPPSKNKTYKRYGEKLVKMAGSEMGNCIGNDIWGTREAIDAIISVADAWLQKGYTVTIADKEIKDILNIGDISLWCGGDHPEHKAHENGKGIDIRTYLAGAMEMGGSANHYFDRDKSVELALIAQMWGFTRMYTMCPYVTENANKNAGKGNEFVTQVEPHMHHFHVDFETNYSLGNRKNILKENIFAHSYCSKCKHKPSCPFSISNYIEP
jgi:hypothetical protein